MKTLAIIFYIVGCGLLAATCFVTTVALTWWFGGFAIACLFAGGYFQYATKEKEYRDMYGHHQH